MKRRKVLSQIAIAATTTTTIVACNETSNSPAVQANDLPNLRWRMVTSWPKSLNTIFGGAQTFCDRISAMTGGKFTIEPYAAGEIVPGLEVLDAVQNGTVECGHTASYYYVGKKSRFGFWYDSSFWFNRPTAKRLVLPWRRTRCNARTI